MKKRGLTWETIFFYIGVIGIAVAVATAILIYRTPLRLTGHLDPCVLYTFFKVPCPGCGGTRALQYLLQGRIGDSFLAHPLVLYAAGAYLYFMIAYGWATFKEKRMFSIEELPFGSGVLIGAGILAVVQWICKLIFW